MSNIFSSTWKDAFRKKTKPVEKMVDDLGDFKGVFSYKEYDKNGIQVGQSEQQNLLVNISKSNIIRILGQGQSSWFRNSINPVDLKIARMRFGIATAPSSNILDYYNFNEISTRPGYTGATTGLVPTYGPFQLDTDQYTYQFGPSSPATERPTFENGYYFFRIKYAQKSGTEPTRFIVNPPSHGTLKVTISAGASGTDLLEFEQPVYPRSTAGIPPSRISTVAGTGIVETSTRVGGLVDATDLTNAETRLFYQYGTNEGWRLRVKMVGSNVPQSGGFRFDIGKYNVINSIVPVVGKNNGVNAGVFPNMNVDLGMQNTGTRYINTSGAGNDFYTINNVDYRDSGTDFIDDFAVTFTTNMSISQGNSSMSGTGIPYTEAFLFNGIDDLFSHVVLTSPFVKSDSNSFSLSWTLLAPIS